MRKFIKRCLIQFVIAAFVSAALISLATASDNYGENLRISYQKYCTTHKFNFAPNGILKLVEVPFVKDEHEIIFDTYQKNVIKSINGSAPYGITAVTLPICLVEKIELSYNGKTYSLNSNDMYNALVKAELAQHISVKCADENTCMIRGLFSDASGTFAAQWEIERGIARRTVLSNKEDVLVLFREKVSYGQ